MNDGYKLMNRVEEKIRKKEAAVSMDRSAQNCDLSSEGEIMNLRRMKFVFDVSPLEIIDNEDDEDFIYGGGGGAVVDINQTDLVMQIIDHGLIYQHWSLKSDQQLIINSSSCHDQHHRNHHHLRDDDDGHNEEDMSIMISCLPSNPDPELPRRLIFGRGYIFASYENQEDTNKDDHSTNDDDYIMSQLLYNVDALYESRQIDTYEDLVEVKRCIFQRISEAKPALVLLARPKAVRIRVDLSTIQKMYYANSAAAAAATAQEIADRRFAAEEYDILYPADSPSQLDYDATEECRYDILYPDSPFQLHYDATEEYDILYPTDSPSQLDYDDEINPEPAGALRSSKEALEVKIFEKENLISSSSCSVCLNEFRVGVDEIKKMPCSHIFHVNCLMIWLLERNTCPICRYQLPTYWSRFKSIEPQ